MAQRVMRSALAAALMLFLARPVPAAGPCRCCVEDWLCPPKPSLPIGDPCYGYNRTVWQPWRAWCDAPQPAILAAPVIETVPAPSAEPTPAVHPTPPAAANLPAAIAPEAPHSPYSPARR